MFGTAPPKFNCDFSGLMVEFGAKSEEVSGKTLGETTLKTREKTREKILKLILANASVSIKEMSDKIGITEKGIEWQIMRLKKDRILERIGPAKGGYWKIKE